MRAKLIFILVGLVCVGCSSKRMIAGHAKFGVECLVAPEPNMVKLVIFSNGRNRLEAKKQARYKALEFVLFGGEIIASDCPLKPLFNDIQRSKNQEFFNQLLSDKDFLLEAANLNDERLGNRIFRDVSKGRKEIVFSFVVTVDLNVVNRNVHKDELKN